MGACEVCLGSRTGGSGQPLLTLTYVDLCHEGLGNLLPFSPDHQLLEVKDTVSHLLVFFMVLSAEPGTGAVWSPHLELFPRPCLSSVAEGDSQRVGWKKLCFPVCFCVT